MATGKARRCLVCDRTIGQTMHKAWGAEATNNPDKVLCHNHAKEFNLSDDGEITRNERYAREREYDLYIMGHRNEFTFRHKGTVSKKGIVEVTDEFDRRLLFRAAVLGSYNNLQYQIIKTLEDFYGTEHRDHEIYFEDAGETLYQGKPFVVVHRMVEDFEPDGPGSRKKAREQAGGEPQ